MTSKFALRLFASAAIAASLFSACRPTPQDKLADEIERAQKECPKSFGSMGELESISWLPADSQVVYAVKFNEKIGALRAFGIQNDTLLMVTALRNSANRSQQSRGFFELIAAAKASLRIDLIGSESADTVRFILDDATIANDVLAAGYMELSEWRRLLENSLRTQMQQLPQSMGNGMTMKNIELNDNEIIYTVELNDAAAKAVADKGLNPDIVKQNMLRMLHGSRSAAQFGALVKSAGYGLRYNFTDAKGDTLLMVTLPNNEIQ